MANYYGSARSNYFEVKDTSKFLEWAEKLEIDVWVEEEKGKNIVGIHSSNEYGLWPDYRYDEEKEIEEEVDFLYELSTHLVPGEVAILMEAGAEKLRYIIGEAVAINHLGVSRRVSLNDIYKLVPELTTKEHIYPAEY